jgi:ketosteroid isomerase-like protein
MSTFAQGPDDVDRPDADRAAVAHATTALLNAVNASDLTGVLAAWCDEGVLMPPHHPTVHGRAALEQYFRGLFSHRRFAFAFTSSRIEVVGDLALERVEYRASAWPAEGGPLVQDVGKGLHVYRRQTDGSWKLAQDIWNSDSPARPGA